MSKNPKYSELRRDIRIRENIGIKWQVKGLNIEGTGRVRNLSTTGMLLHFNQAFSPVGNYIFHFESLAKGVGAYLPSEGRLVWHKKTSNNNHFCGIEFTGVDESVLSKLRTRIEAAIQQVTQMALVKNVVGFALTAVMLLMTIYVLNLQTRNYQVLETTSDMSAVAVDQMAGNYRNYVQQFKVTKAELIDTQERLNIVTLQLDEVTRDLNSTKTLLAESQMMLSSAHQENELLKVQIKELEALRQSVALAGEQTVEQLEGTINSLKQENETLSGELSRLDSQMKSFEVDVNDMTEGRSLITLFKNRIKFVKSKMRQMQKQAYFAKVAAQQERDRQEYLLGNNGFFVKEGQPKNSTAASEAEGAKTIKIDVELVQ